MNYLNLKTNYTKYQQLSIDLQFFDAIKSNKSFLLLLLEATTLKKSIDTQKNKHLLFSHSVFSKKT